MQMSGSGYIYIWYQSDTRADSFSFYFSMCPPSHLFLLLVGGARLIYAAPPQQRRILSTGRHDCWLLLPLVLRRQRNQTSRTWGFTCRTCVPSEGRGKNKQRRESKWKQFRAHPDFLLPLISIIQVSQTHRVDVVNFALRRKKTGEVLSFQVSPGWKI